MAERRALAAILVLAALARLACLPVVGRVAGYLPDVLSYREAAADLRAGRLFVDPTVMPGYPLIVFLSGGGGIGQALVDIALSLVGIWYLVRITREITGDAVTGLLAGLLWALYPFAIFYAVIGLTESAFVTVILLAFLAFYRGRFALGSLALAVAILIRPAVEILAPFLILAFVFLVHRGHVRDALRHLGVFALIYLALMTPWWWHNYEKYGTFVRLNLASGLVLYTGNNPLNRSGGGIGSGVDVDVSGFTGIRDLVERDRAMREAAVKFIRENPSRFIELAALKFKRLWQPWPHAEEYNKPLLIAISVASYLPLLLLGIAGAIWGARRYGPKLVPIALFIGYTTAVHMVTIGTLRYRFPMEPFLAVLAAPILALGARRLARQ